RVDRTEGGAVAEAQVVEALDAKGRPDLLEVERRVGGTDVGEEVAGAGDAVGGEREVGDGERTAVDRRVGQPDAPRVPPDRVELAQELRREHVDEPPRERRAG